MDTHSFLLLAPLGLVVGALGTLIGAGGGFILMPILLMMYPEEPPDAITAVSLTVVCLNALSGSAAYARMRRIDLHSGLLFAAATIPGAVLGAMTTSHIPRRAFDLVFGVVMLALAGFLAARPAGRPDAGRKPSRRAVTRTLTEADGTVHRFSYNPRVGVGISVGVGYLSSVLGIGGGIIHVPALVHVLSFPVHIATATSQFILAVMAMAGVGVHLAHGTLQGAAAQTPALAIGVVLGAQVGARLSRRLHGTGIIRTLATALGLVGLRILIMALRV